ncbi:MAG: hypothetical protein Q9169_005209 [Polycauliona sp. 2 TL-2023]
MFHQNIRIDRNRIIRKPAKEHKSPLTNDSLQTENNNLRSQLDSLVSKNIELKKQLDDLKKDWSTVKEKNRALNVKLVAKDNVFDDLYMQTANLDWQTASFVDTTSRPTTLMHSNNDENGRLD